MQFVKGGPDIPERLLQAHEDGRVVFFCGAGISYPAGLPGFASLVKELYSRLEIIPNPVQVAAMKAKRYDTAVGLLEANTIDGRRAVRETLVEILDPDLSSPNATATHHALLTLAESRERRTRLITTNFDRLFEHAIAMRQPAAERFQAPLLPVPKSRWNGLVYLHGLLPEHPAENNLDNLVVSSGDFGLAYLTERWAARFVSELLRNFIVCFVGYSIDDPVLRYMMDALAADRLLGESPPEMFAFGSHSKGKKTTCDNEWRAKNVTPILYREHRRHAYLHRTLRAWSDTYRDGARGKERIVVEYAIARPDTATNQDDFVSRMLWALSDSSGLPAMRFADLDPVPSLDWLEAIAEDRFRHADLVRFGVPPKASADAALTFSLSSRPSPYDLAPRMALAIGATRDASYDSVMWSLARWLTRHLNNPALLLWLVKQGARPHPQLSRHIERRMNELAAWEDEGRRGEMDRIRATAPDAIPDASMRTLWRLLLSGGVKVVEQDLDLYEWRTRLARSGLTATLRTELREMLTPRVSLREPLPWPFDNDEDEDEEVPVRIRQLVDWEIVLSAEHLHTTLRDPEDNASWRAALPTLLSDFTWLLRDVLELMKELGGANERSDLSYATQPSISEHPQNSAFRDWTALIDLNRDAWLATAAESRERARLAAQAWSEMPYPLFRRLAFFAAAQGDIIPSSRGLGWLLADDEWWLWSVEIRRETMRLLVALAPRLDDDGLARLERAILAGPPRDMYRADIEEERWIRIQEGSIWLRLAKVNQAGATLNAEARERLDDLSGKHPDWQLAENGRDEFPTWSGEGGDLRIHVTAPREREELIAWLRGNPDPDEWRPDDWAARCRDDFDVAASALAALAAEGTWPAGRWRDALQRWSEDEFTERSWREVGPVLAEVPSAVLQDLTHAVGWWLERIARTFQGQEETFLSLCDRLLAVDYDVDEVDEDLVGHAINHPVGQVTEALLRWWYRGNLADEQGLADELRHRFGQLCDTETAKFRDGRVLLAGHAISLFRVDREWSIQYMLPLFEWERSPVEAQAAWEGFLWSPRVYPPLMEVLGPAFLDTANHYAQLGRHREHYASLLTFVALDPRGVFAKPDLARATRALPQAALEHTTETLFRAVDSAGDQRADYWRNRVGPYLRTIWPKTPDVNSEEVAEGLARACVAAGDAFPEGFQQVRAWLRPLQYPERVAHSLHEAQLDTRFPESALELLHRIVGDEARGWFRDLTACLAAVRAARQDLEDDARFRRLVDILRANGAELD